MVSPGLQCPFLETLHTVVTAPNMPNQNLLCRIHNFTECRVFGQLEKDFAASQGEAIFSFGCPYLVAFGRSLLQNRRVGSLDLI